MSPKLKPLDKQTMVITGATSGIGLATAKAAANQGARLVLAARNEDELRHIADEINTAGGDAIFQATDVSLRDEVQSLAQTSIDRFGGFDCWVNNAAVGLYGPLEEFVEADARRLFDVNFWGAVYGSLTATAHLRERGGALINVGSVASDSAIAYMGMYSASKHALRGFTDALRLEIDRDETPVSITLIKPTSINTPFPQHARNYTEREPQVPPPVYQPDHVAKAILHAATHPVRELYVGGSGRIMTALASAAPRAMDWVARNIMAENEFRDEPPRNPQGTLYETGENGNVYGDHPGYVHRTSLYTTAAMHPVLTALTAAAVVATASTAAAWFTKDGQSITRRGLKQVRNRFKS